MTDGRPTLLEELASELIDHLTIDWERVRRRAGEPTSSWTGLQLLEQVGQTYQAASRARTEAEDTPALFRWGPLEVREPIGRGSYSEVYRAWDPQLDRTVALKLRRDSCPRSPASWLAEGRRLARLRHPHVLTVYGAAVFDGRAGIWSEFLPGPNLDRLLEEEGPLPYERLLTIGREVRSGLRAIHQADLIHGDVKAANVALRADGSAVLVDLGSGRIPGATSDLLGSQGSPITTAPEILDGGRPSRAGDYYSFGALLYHLAASRPPIESSHYTELLARAKAGDTTPLSELRPDLPASFVTAVHRTLALDPEARRAGYDSFDQASDPELAVAGPKPPRSTVRRPRFFGLLAVATLLLTVGALAWTLRDRAAIAPVVPQVELARLGPQGGALRDGDPTRLGERLVLDLEVDHPAYLYLLNEDEKGALFVLYPLSSPESPQPLPAGQHRLPGLTEEGERQSWVVTSAGGVEHFLVVVSRREVPVLEEFRRSHATAGERELPVPEAPTRSEDMADRAARDRPTPAAPSDVVRGVGGVAREFTLPPRLAQLSAEISEIPGTWQRSIRLVNPEFTPLREE